MFTDFWDENYSHLLKKWGSYLITMLVFYHLGALFLNTEIVQQKSICNDSYEITTFPLYSCCLTNISKAKKLFSLTNFWIFKQNPTVELFDGRIISPTLIVVINSVHSLHMLHFVSHTFRKGSWFIEINSTSMCDHIIQNC